MNGLAKGIVVRAVGRLLGHFHGHQFRILPEGHGNVEHAHNVQDKVGLLAVVDSAGECFAVVGRLQYFPDFAFRKEPDVIRLDNQAVNAVRNPRRIRYPDAFQTVVGRAVRGIVEVGHADGLEILQHFEAQGVVAAGVVPYANLPVVGGGKGVDVLLYHVLQLALDRQPFGADWHTVHTPGDFSQNRLFQQSDAVAAMIRCHKRGSSQDSFQVRIPPFQVLGVYGHIPAQIRLVQGQNHGAVGRERFHGLHPHDRLGVHAAVLAAVADDDVNGVGGEETAVHGVHNLLSAEVHDAQGHGAVGGRDVPLGDGYAVGGQRIGV